MKAFRWTAHTAGIIHALRAGATNKPRDFVSSALVRLAQAGYVTISRRAELTPLGRECYVPGLDWADGQLAKTSKPWGAEVASRALPAGCAVCGASRRTHACDEEACEPTHA